MKDLFVLGQSSGGVFSQNATGGPAPREGEQRQLGCEPDVLPGKIRAPEREEDSDGLDKRAYWGSRKRNGMSWARETTQTEEQSQAWSCDHGSSM